MTEKKKKLVAKKRKKKQKDDQAKEIQPALAPRTLLKSRKGMFCSNLGIGAPVPSPPNVGCGGPAAVTITGDIAPMLALPLSDATQPLPAPSSGELNVISSAPWCVPSRAGRGVAIGRVGSMHSSNNIRGGRGGRDDVEPAAGVRDEVDVVELEHLVAAGEAPVDGGEEGAFEMGKLGQS